MPPYLCAHFGRTTPKVVERLDAQTPGHPRRQPDPPRRAPRRDVFAEEQGEGSPGRADRGVLAQERALPGPVPLRHPPLHRRAHQRKLAPRGGSHRREGRNPRCPLRPSAGDGAALPAHRRRRRSRGRARDPRAGHEGLPRSPEAPRRGALRRFVLQARRAVGPARHRVHAGNRRGRVQRAGPGRAGRHWLSHRRAPLLRPRARAQQARARAAHRRVRSAEATPGQRERQGAGGGGEATEDRVSAAEVTPWTFGDFTHSTNLAHALYGFFNNGGSKAFVCNVAPKSVTAEQAAKEAEKKEAEAKKAAESGKPAAAPAPAAAAAPSGAPNPALYVGKDEGPGRRTGLNVFNDIPEISLVCAPGQSDAAIQDAVISHCENNKYRFAILDSAEELGKDGIAKMPKPRDSQYAAYYFPWIQVYDPEKGNIFVPPSGHVAGIYARSDSERGVDKAPANEHGR